MTEPFLSLSAPERPSRLCAVPAEANDDDVQQTLLDALTSLPSPSSTDATSSASASKSSEGVQAAAASLQLVLRGFNLSAAAFGARARQLLQIFLPALGPQAVALRVAPTLLLAAPSR